MSAENLEIAKAEYQAGKTAFERGDYRRSVQHLEKARLLSVPNSQFGGEVQIWLVTAYEAADQRTEALALCQLLSQHPMLETRQQAKQLKYILEAPQLNKRPEWLTQIPDLGALADSDPRDQKGSSRSPIAPAQSAQPRALEAPPDPKQVNTQDNRFIWVALGAIGLVLGGLLWLS